MLGLISLLLAAVSCPAVDAELSGDRWTRAAEAAFRTELSVETTRSAKCLGENAKVRLVWQSDEPVGVSVTWRTGETERVLRRAVAPGSVPADGLMLALAAVVSELLRETETPGPVAEVEEAPPAVAEPQAPRTAAVFARLGGALYGSGALFGGGAVALRLALPARLELDVSLGGRGAATRSTAAGSVTLASVGGALGLALKAVDFDAFSLLPLVQVEAGWVWGLAAPAVGFTAQGGGAFLLAARAGLELAFRPGAAWWALGVTVGAPLRGAAFTDGASAVASVSGIEGGVTLSAGPAW